MKFIVLMLFWINFRFGKTAEIYNDYDINDTKIDMLVDIMTRNLKTNGWINLLFIGNLPNRFYEHVKLLPVTISVSNTSTDDQYIEDAVPYHSNFIIMDCSNYEEFEKALKKTLGSPYWHPLSHIIVYYHSQSNTYSLAKIYYTLWYYKGLNAIVIQDDDAENMRISFFSPYISDSYRLDHEFGCATVKKVGMPIRSYRSAFDCYESCFNVSLHSNLRAKHLGTCIGITTHSIAYGDMEALQKLTLFDDKTKDLHGFIMRAFIIEVPPFLKIGENPDGSYIIYARDGMIWSPMAELMNFQIDLSPAKNMMKKRFSYDVNVQKIFEFTERKADLILFPVYQFDLIIAKLDNTFPFMESGVCFISYRPDFETMLFDIKLLQDNYYMILECIICFICIWFVFYIFNIQEHKRFKLDQAGIDFLNVCRMILSVSLHNPPKRTIFRLFLACAIWSFFIINFSTQAHIIALFSSYKRGKNVDTFEDIIEKGYFIEGIGSPDAILPDNEERYRKINAKLISHQDIFTCIDNMQNDTRRFCLIDCAVGRYLELNLLNEKGEQYLHVARRDRIHSLYLNMIFQQYSPLTHHYNKYIQTLFEGGIIRKWMEYRYKIVGDEVPFKVLTMDDLKGIFQCYGMLLGFSSVVFIIEESLGNFGKVKQWIKAKVNKNNISRKKFKGYSRERWINFCKKKKRHEIATQTNEPGT